MLALPAALLLGAVYQILLQHPKAAPQQPNKRSFTQLHLDVGQANFACITCSVCGLIYAKGEANDEKVHALFHANCTQGVNFQGWQHERVVKWDGREGRVLVVIPDDPAAHLKKVKEICGVVEDHLGLCKGWLLSAPYQVYLYISSSKYVRGCVVAERITAASPTAPARMRSDSPTSAGSTAAFKHGDSQAAAETRLEQCGINSPIPMMPLTDVTNMCDVSTSGASAAMATDHDGPESSHLAVCTSSQQVLKVNGSALSSAYRDGSMWQQAPDLVECTPSWSEGGTPQVCHDVAARTTDHPAADGSVSAEATAAFEALETASQSLSRLRPEGQTEILMTDRSKAVKAVCGIKVMWVSAQARRQGIATQLLDTARCHCVAGYVVPRSQLAFSQPTQAGRRLAEQYTQTHSFLVYQ
ncbi:hypothetical protein WJX82_007662 [Trebouxia sp. C0006]